MIAASLVKELKLLSRDLHGLAVLFVMPITFMLIMSVALSRDADPHHGSRIALVGVADDAVNKQFAAGLAKDDIQVTLMQPEKLDDAQSGLHDRRFQLVLHNPNRAADKLADSKPKPASMPILTTAASQSTTKNCPPPSAKTSKRK